jgi:hypothetical protein
MAEYEKRSGRVRASTIRTRQYVPSFETVKIGMREDIVCTALFSTPPKPSAGGPSISSDAGGTLAVTTGQSRYRNRPQFGTQKITYIGMPLCHVPRSPECWRHNGLDVEAFGETWSVTTPSGGSVTTFG